MPLIDFSNLPKRFNRKYYKYLNDFRRYQIYKGGASAGKSTDIAGNRIYNIIKHNGFNGLVVRKIGRDNHGTTFQELKKAINRFGPVFNNLFRVNEARGQEKITCVKNKNQIIFRGLDAINGDAAGKIKSVTFDTGPLNWIWIEEADQVSEEDFNQLDIRLRGKCEVPNHIIMSFNPIDSDHWIKKRFFDTKIPDADGFICHSTYLDNRFLDSHTEKVLESYKEKDWYYYQVYCLGNWGNRAGTTVFRNIEVSDFDVEEEHYRNIRYGIDWGFNHAKALVGTGYRDGELIIFREWYARETLIKDYEKIVGKTFPKDYGIVGDSADPEAIVYMRSKGYKIYGAKKGPGSLLLGVNYLKRLPKIKIHATNCPNAAREFKYFKYRQDKNGTVHDEVVEIDDDTIAATRYGNEEFFLTGAGQGRQKKRFLKVRGM